MYKHSLIDKSFTRVDMNVVFHCYTADGGNTAAVKTRKAYNNSVCFYLQTSEMHLKLHII